MATQADGGRMITRVVLSEDFLRAIRVRGLTLTTLAVKAKVSLPTVSSAVHQRPINASSALRLCRALAETPVVDELDKWVAPTVPGQSAA